MASWDTIVKQKEQIAEKHQTQLLPASIADRLAQNQAAGLPTWTPPKAADPPKAQIAICTPFAFPMVHAEWTFGLIRLLQRMPMKYTFYANRGTPVDVSRNHMVRSGLRDGVEWFFFLDSDVIVPPNCLNRLLSHKLPLVSGIYHWKKSTGYYPCVLKLIDGVFTPLDNKNEGLHEIDIAGMGCVLVHRKVFESIPPPWFYFEKDAFDDEGKPTERSLSEDFYFFLLAKQYQVKLYADFHDDTRCDHLGEFGIRKDGKVTPTIP